MKQKQISLAKITGPNASGLLPRTRLFRLIDKNRSKPLIWITGPPGSGKTSLISSYLNERKLPSTWYQVDGGDADIATFFYYMGLAAQKISSQRRKPLPLFTPEYLYGIPAFTHKYFDGLFNRLKPPFMLIFDNYQDVPEDSSFHEVIVEGLTRVPREINTFIISRNEPPAIFSRMRANSLMGIIGWDDMRFDLRESGEIIRRRGYKKISPAMLQNIHDAVNGWAAGLILMLESFKRAEEMPLLGKNKPEEIFNYFANEIFSKTEREVQDFLLKTAFMRDMTVTLAEELTGVSRTEQILSDLVRRNYFTIRHAPQDYKYHSLFREFLLYRARTSFTEKEVKMIQRRAAQILEGSGKIEAAVELFREISDWEEMVRIILGNAQTLFAQGRYRIVKEWLESIPGEVIEQSPYLLYCKGISLLPFNPSESRNNFEKAFELFRIRDDRAGMFLSWPFIVYSTMQEGEDYSLMDNQISLLEDILRENPLFPSEELRDRITMGMFTSLGLRQTYHPDISLWEGRAFELLERSRDQNLCLETGIPLSIYHLWHGNFDRAKLALNILREKTLSPVASTLAIITLKIPEAIYDWLVSASHDSCLGRASKALKLAEDTGVHIWDHNLLCHIIASSLSSGDIGKAEEFSEEFSKTLNKTKKIDRSFYFYLSAWKELLKGDISLALHYSQRHFDLSRSLGLPFAIALSHHGMAEVLKEKGDYKKTEEHLSQAFSISRRIKSNLLEYMCFITEASLYFTQRKEREGSESLRKALALGREKGYLNTFGWRPDIMTDLCVKALEKGIEIEYVQDLIRQRNLIPERPPVDLENWPWPIKMHTLGRFGLLKEEKPVRFSKKVQQRPLDLLKALISLGGRDVKETQLTDSLWPEADGDTAHISFTTNLHRLRRLIGDEAVKLQEGRITLNPKYCWVDIWAFERMLQQVDEEKKSAPSKALQLAEKAIDMYSGHFLKGDSDKPWTISLREHLKDKFMRAVSESAAYQEKAEEWKKAVECYKRGLDIDDLAEEFYQRLMVCYQKLGHKAEALTIYERCKKVISSALGVEPSPETEAIYNAIRQKH